MKTTTKYQILAVAVAAIICIITGFAKAEPAELLSQKPEEGLSIAFIPTSSEGKTVYYVPDEETGEELLDLIMNADGTKELSQNVEKWPKDFLKASDRNVTIYYGEYTLYLREGGFLKAEYWPEDYSGSRTWMAKDGRVQDFIMNLLKEKAGFETFDIGRIENIVRAELQDGKFYGGTPHEPVVITDEAQLKSLEKLLADAELSFASGCPFGLCRLILTTAEGNEITLIPAVDSCTVFYADGVFYDYMPAEYRGKEEHPDNSVLFDMLGVSVEEYQQTNEAYYGR